jgi:hypothetical protein
MVFYKLNLALEMYSVGQPWSRQSAHRWWQGCQFYAPDALNSPETLFFNVSGTHFCWRLSKPQGPVWPEGLGKLQKFIMQKPNMISNKILGNHFQNANNGQNNY